MNFTRPEIDCHELPAFEPSNLDVVRAAFEHATPVFLHQTWRQTEEAGFMPATVRTGWRNDSLLVLADLADVDIYSLATALNQKMWELGDTFEIFLRPETQETYVEFHVTPNNQRLQMRFTKTVAPQPPATGTGYQSSLITGDAFRSQTWLRPASQQWFAYAEIPAKSVCDQPGPVSGSQWRFSFSRYDYTREQKTPVISSSSPHAAPGFHRQAEWGLLRFRGR